MSICTASEAIASSASRFVFPGERPRRGGVRSGALPLARRPCDRRGERLRNGVCRLSAISMPRFFGRARLAERRRGPRRCCRTALRPLELAGEREWGRRACPTRDAVPVPSWASEGLMHSCFNFPAKADG